MLTLGTIIQNLHRFDPNGTRIAGIPYVRATSLKVGYSKTIVDGHGGYIVRSICKTKTPRPDHTGYDDYVTTIDFISPKGYVKVSCSCPDFWSTFEYALNAKGAADIHYCNGERPDERNPRLVAGCCKHVAKMATVLKQIGYIDPSYRWIPQAIKKKK